MKWIKNLFKNKCNNCGEYWSQEMQDKFNWGGKCRCSCGQLYEDALR